MAEKSDTYYIWMQYKTADREWRKGILKALDLDTNLPLLPWRGQVDILEGAPDEIVVKYLPKLYFKAQIVVFENLPVKLLDECEKLLDSRVKKKLGLVSDKKKIKWIHTELC